MDSENDEKFDFGDCYYSVKCDSAHERERTDHLTKQVTIKELVEKAEKLQPGTEENIAKRIVNEIECS
jgi:hypothetical protein